MVLIDQLELLRSSMDSMLDAAVHADAQALIARGRFLDAKFGRVTPTVPDRTAPAPPPAASSSSNTGSGLMGSRHDGGRTVGLAEAGLSWRSGSLMVSTRQWCARRGERSRRPWPGCPGARGLGAHHRRRPGPGLPVTAASRGRRWRSGPTPVLSDLVARSLARRRGIPPRSRGCLRGDRRPRARPRGRWAIYDDRRSPQLRRPQQPSTNDCVRGSVAMGTGGADRRK